MSKEVFKDIYIGDDKTIYAISTKGRVYNRKRKKFLKPHICERHVNKALSELEPNNMYINYALHHKGKYYYCQAHRLVAEYFIPIPEKYKGMGLEMKDLHVDHKDNVRYHNYVENLQWLTPKENVEKVTQDGRQRYASGSKHGMCNLTDSQLDKVGELLSENILTQSEISKVTGVPYDTILEIRAGRRFRYLRKKYDFSHYDKFERAQSDEKTLRNALLLLESGKFNIKEVSEMTGLNYSTISGMVHGRPHKSLVAEYNLKKIKKRSNKLPKIELIVTSSPSYIVLDVD